MLKTLQTRQEREWFRRNQMTRYYHKISTSSLRQSVMSHCSNLSTVPLFVNRQNELVSVRYDGETRDLWLGTQTKFQIIHAVERFKCKKGYVVCLTPTSVCYMHIQSNNTIQWMFENKDVVLFDGLWDTCTNTCVTVTGDTRQNYLIRKNEDVIQSVCCTNMLDMVSLCGKYVSWDVPSWDPKIYEVNFLSCIGRWLVESSEYIYILDDVGYRMFMQDKSKVTHMILNDTHTFDGMIYDYDRNEVYVSDTHDILMYQKNGYLFVAQTVHPYHIKHTCCGDVLPRIYRWYDHLANQETMLETIEGIYKLSMEPKSLTASTKIDTTLE